MQSSPAATAFRAAMERLREGEPSAAAAIVREALVTSPADPDLLALLGASLVALRDTGAVAKAEIIPHGDLAGL